MSLDRELTIKEKKEIFKKSKYFLEYFFDNSTIEHAHFYDRAKCKKKIKSLENIYCPCVELMNYKLLKENNIHCIKNNEMFWNDIENEGYDGYSYGDFSLEINYDFYQLEVTSIYSPKNYRSIKKKLLIKLINSMKYKDQAIIFVNMMNWFISPEDICFLRKFIWETKKTKYNFEKVEAVAFIKHDLNFKVKRIEFIQKTNSTKDLTELKDLAIMYNE